MKRILYLLQKEFIQVFRNKTMLPIIFVMPLFQMLLLVFAATLEMKNIHWLLIDQDQTQTSRELVAKFNASPFYVFSGSETSTQKAFEHFYDNSADMILLIPEGLEKDVMRNQNPQIQFLVNAVNGMTAGLINSYSSQIIGSFNKEMATQLLAVQTPVNTKQIDIKQRFWYNPTLNYKFYMVPGILVILVTLIGAFLTAFNIVREKEMGTIEQINVTPIRKMEFMTGKLLPFLIIALFDLALGLAIGKLLFDIPMLGSLPLLFAFALIYLILVLGFGLLLSVSSNSLQQVMFTSFFFMLIFILMSGLFTPIETMPDWAQKINSINPLAYFMKVNRMILLKGSQFRDLWKDYLIVGLYGVLVFAIAVRLYRKTT